MNSHLILLMDLRLKFTWIDNIKLYVNQLKGSENKCFCCRRDSNITKYKPPKCKSSFNDFKFKMDIGYTCMLYSFAKNDDKEH